MVEWISHVTLEDGTRGFEMISHVMETLEAGEEEEEEEDEDKEEENGSEGRKLVGEAHSSLGRRT